MARHLEGNRALVARHRIADPGGFVELPDARSRLDPAGADQRRRARRGLREVVAAIWAEHGPLAALDRIARLSGLFTRVAARARAAR